MIFVLWIFMMCQHWAKNGWNGCCVRNPHEISTRHECERQRGEWMWWSTEGVGVAALLDALSGMCANMCLCVSTKLYLRSHFIQSNCVLIFFSSFSFAQSLFLCRLLCVVTSSKFFRLQNDNFDHIAHSWPLIIHGHTCIRYNFRSTGHHIWILMRYSIQQWFRVLCVRWMNGWEGCKRAKTSSPTCVSSTSE